MSILISSKKADEIFNNIVKEWIKRYGYKQLNQKTLVELKILLHALPDEDGCKRCVSLETGKTHLVPVEKIILEGLRGDELHKFPVCNG